MTSFFFFFGSVVKGSLAKLDHRRLDSQEVRLEIRRSFFESDPIISKPRLSPALYIQGTTT